MSLKVYSVKYQGFNHIVVNCTTKPLVIKERKDMSEKKD